MTDRPKTRTPQYADPPPYPPTVEAVMAEVKARVEQLPPGTLEREPPIALEGE